MSNHEAESDTWVLATSCNWLHEAHFLKSVLESAGIATLLPDEHTIGIQPLYANLLGGVRILVRSSDLARAQEVLQLDASRPPANDDENDR